MGPDLSDKLAQIGVHTVLDVRLSSKDALQRACGTTKGETLLLLSLFVQRCCMCKALARAWHPMGCPSLLPACLQSAMVGMRLRINQDTLQAACGASVRIQGCTATPPGAPYVWSML